mgnify:CR=1 FL=1
MASGDITVLEQNSEMGRGARLYNVAAGTAILAGEPVQHRVVGATVVEPSLTSTPVVGTSGVEGLFVGIAATNSTNTATAAGSVYVTPVNSGTTYLIAPAVAASWDTQAEYDALEAGAQRIADAANLQVTAISIEGYSINDHTGMWWDPEVPDLIYARQ